MKEGIQTLLSTLLLEEIYDCDFSMHGRSNTMPAFREIIFSDTTKSLIENRRAYDKIIRMLGLIDPKERTDTYVYDAYKRAADAINKISPVIGEIQIIRNMEKVCKANRTNIFLPRRSPHSERYRKALVNLFMIIRMDPVGRGFTQQYLDRYEI